MTPSHPKKPPVADPVDTLDAQVDTVVNDLTAVTDALVKAQESERRALADYQNLVRRTQDERMKAIKFANRELLSALLEPLDHLSRAAEQLHDKGLDMVVQEFWQVLELAGLEEIKTVGQPFNPLTMEVVEVGSDSHPDKKQVTKCLKKGYTLHGTVLQPAKVAVN